MMNKKFSKTEMKGLPGGPNQQFTYVTGVFLQDMYHVPIAQKGLEKYQGNGKSETLVPKEKLDRYLRNTQAKLIDDSGVPLYKAYDDALPTPTVRAYNVPTTAEKFGMIGSTLRDKGIEAAKTIKDVSPIGAAQRLYERGSDELAKDMTSFGQSFVNYLKNPLPYYRSTPEEQERSGSILDIAEVVPFVGLGAKAIKQAANPFRKTLLSKNPFNTNKIWESYLNKSIIEEVKPFANRYDNIITSNPLSTSRAKNLIEQGRKKEVYNDFFEGSLTIDNFVEDYLKDLTSPEGIKRLTNQEADYLRSIGIPESQIASKAEQAAFARINEIKDIKNLNKKISESKDEFDYDLVTDDNLYNNAFYRRPSIVEFWEDVIPKKGIDNTDPDRKAKLFLDVLRTPSNYNRIGLKSAPGQTVLGSAFKKSKPVAAHEIAGHGLQAGRVLPVDNRLRQDLGVYIGDLNNAERKAYDYFLEGNNKIPGESLEPSAFLHELREAMLQAGLIKNRYQYVSPELIEIAKTYFTRRPSGVVNQNNLNFLSNTRILDFMDPTKSNYDLISRELNKLPALIPGAIGLSALQNKQQGGEGYREGAPNYNASSKLIPSGNITMTEKDGGPLKKGPLLGIDNLGNQQMMFPGYNYVFPGDMVMEIPVAQKGNGEISFFNRANDAYKQGMFLPFLEDQVNESLDGTMHNNLPYTEQQKKLMKEVHDAHVAMTDYEHELYKLLGSWDHSKYNKEQQAEYQRLYDKFYNKKNSKEYKQFEKEVLDFRDENSDALRHTYTSAMTAQKIRDKVRENAPFLKYLGADRSAGFIGANLLGIGHELSVFARDNRPFMTKLQESGKDIYNNFIGSLMGVGSTTPKEAAKYTENAVRKGWTTSGYVEVEKQKGGSNKPKLEQKKYGGNMPMEIPVMQKAQFGKHFSGKDAYLDVFGNVVPINEGGLKAITGEATLKYGTEDNPMYLRSSLKPFAGYTTDGFNIFDIQGSSGIGIGSKGYNAELGFTKNLLNNQKPSLYTSVGYNDEKFGINASTNIPNKNNPYIFPNLNLRYTPNEILSINADATYDPIARSPRVQAGLNYRFQRANKPKLEKEQYGGEKAYETWERITGTPWADAKTKGLTDGSYESNLKLQRKLLQEEIDYSKVNPTKEDVIPEQKTDVTTVDSKDANFDDFTFNDAFKKAREMYGPNKIFKYKGRLKNTNRSGEPLEISDEELTKWGLNTKKNKSKIKEENEIIESPYTSQDDFKMETISTSVPKDETESMMMENFKTKEETLKEGGNQFEYWSDIKQKQKDLNKNDNAKVVVGYQKDKAKSDYVVIDKSKGLMHLYHPKEDKPYLTYPVDLGANFGDGQTATKTKDLDGDGKITSEDRVNGKYKVDWEAGNKTTGAGKFYISNLRKEGYAGLPSFNMMNEQQYNEYKKTGKIERVSTSIHSGYISDDERRVSNGCIRCTKGAVDKLYNVLQGESEVFILPEEDQNKFYVKDDKLYFKNSNRNRYFKYGRRFYKKDDDGKWYISDRDNKKFQPLQNTGNIYDELDKNAVDMQYDIYEDKKGNIQKGQGINRTPGNKNYRPIKIDINEDAFLYDKGGDEARDRLENVVKPYAEAIEDKKKQIMDLFNITSDEYNDLIPVAMGILGNETNFGEEFSSLGDLARFANKAIGKLIGRTTSSPDYKSKYHTYGVRGDDNSVGLTQFRWKYMNEGDLLKKMEKLGVVDNSDLLRPEKAAVHTMGRLAFLLRNRKYNKEADFIDTIPGFWGGSSSDNKATYTRGVKNNSKYFNVMQYKQKGGEMFRIYKDYINGKDNSEDAKKVYDKLNLNYYYKAKQNNMSAPNYIMTNIIE